MKQASTLLVILLLITVCSFTQRRARIQQVTSTNQINGTPYIILPRAAVKIKVSVIEFSYTIGKSLREYIKIDWNKCGTTDDEKKKSIKKALEPLSDEYDVSTEVLYQLLKRDVGKDEEEYKVYKMDKDVNLSALSLLDPAKIYKYINLNSPLNSGLLTLEYDENGILVSSKQTDEPKLIPTIFSAVTGLAGIITATKSAGAAQVVKKDGASGQCVQILHTKEEELDKAILKYNDYLINSVSIFTEKQYEKGREKLEEAMTKQLSNLFYARTIRIIPVEIVYIIPATANSTDEYPIFQFDALTGKLNYESGNSANLLLTPKNQFSGTTTLANPVKLKLSTIADGFNKAALLTGLTTEPDKKTVVFNIPKSMRIELLKAGSTEAYKDTVIKIPQRGTVGFMSMRPSNLELTYDTNGELRKITAERKSVLDQVPPGFTATKDLLTATKKPADKTELELLKEHAETLETLKKIKDLEKEDD